MQGKVPSSYNGVRDVQLNRQVAHRMVAKIAVVCFLAGCTFASSESLAVDEPVVVTGLRDQLRASIGPGFEHVRTIQRPTRRVTAAHLGNPVLVKPGAKISIVGTLSDQQVRAILGLVGDGVVETTKVTGDQTFAVVQLGDAEHDPCCTTAVLFENRDGIWTNLGSITQSH